MEPPKGRDARLAGARLALKLGQQLLDDLDGITDNLVLGSTKNGGIRVLVDGDDALRPTDAGKMLDGARNTDTHEKPGRNRYARLANLVAILQPTRLHDGTRATKLGTQGIGEPSHQRQVFLGTNAATHHDQALGIGDLWPLMEKEEPNIVANLGNYYPSMAQDAVLHQRQTEISVLNGAIARYGERLGVPTPFNTVITKVISCIQNNYDKQYLG